MSRRSLKKTASHEVVVEKLVEQITCAVCLDEYTNPKALPCAHSFCLTCLEAIPVTRQRNGGRYSLNCPTCRKPCTIPTEGLSSLPTSFMINNMKELRENVLTLGAQEDANTNNTAPCSVCEAGADAGNYCKQCNSFLCPDCLRKHDDWSPNASHKVVNIDHVIDVVQQQLQTKPDSPKTPPGSLPPSCADHEKPLDIYCDTCTQLICRDCTVRKHRDHDYDLVKDSHRKHKEILIKDNLQPLTRHFDRLTEAKERLLEQKEEFERQTRGTEDDVRQLVGEIKNILDETEEQLMEEIEMASTQIIEVFDKQLEEVDEALNEVSECKDHVDDKIIELSALELLREKQEMMAHAQGVITSVEGKAFEPLRQPDIQLVKSDAIHQIHNNVGKIEYTPVAFLAIAKVLFSPKASYGHIPLVEEESTVTISLNASLPNGSLVPVPSSLIKWSLTPPDNTPPIQCSVKKSSQSGQYDIVFTPLTRGLHQLHITVEDRTFPVSFPVTVPPQRRGTRIGTLTGFNKPSKVAIMKDNQVAVSGFWKHGVNLVNSQGEKFKLFGTKGTSPGQYMRPQGIAYTSRETILIVDCNNFRLQDLSVENGETVCVGTKGDGPLQFNKPRGITIDKTTDQVFVADTENHRIQVLNPDLTFSHMFGSKGSGQGQFDHPHDVTIDSQGFVYVTDCYNNRIQKFSRDGQFVSMFGNKDHLDSPSGITVDDRDVLYVNNFKNEYVVVYTNEGQFVTSFSKGDLNDSVYSPLYGITYSHTTGDLYVSCTMESAVKIF